MVSEAGKVLCDCGKWVMPTKYGRFWNHRTDVPEMPGSRHMKLCDWSGKFIEDQVRDRGTQG